jgi:DUF1680 family protein
MTCKPECRSKKISVVEQGCIWVLFSLTLFGVCSAKSKMKESEAIFQSSVSQTLWNRRPLSQNAFTPLPLGSIKPEGWLRQQLQIQADGLSGHLDEFWPDLGPSSGWLGGNGESWERGPYYLDGLVPLAYLLEDPRMICKAKKWVEWTLTHQRENGAIGPDRNKGKFQQEWQAQDWWPDMVMLKVLTQYQEATQDPRVVPLMQKYFAYHLKYASQRPLVEWASYRWAEEVLSLVWLYNRTGDSYLLDLARVLQQQAFDWKAHFADFKYKEKVSKKDALLKTHVVNNAMAIKTSAVWWQISGDESDRKAIYQLLGQMDRYHGLPNGVHSGDEHYAGLDPSQGTELCAVVEGMFSFEKAMAILGHPAFGDRLERIAYNALPATFKPDMWAHQYDQQPNQVLCSVLKGRNWTTNGPDSNIFGLEPNFGCCTSNMHQGWPKFVSHLWMATRQEGLVAVAYGPCQVTARVRGGISVKIVEETDYPFRDTIRLSIRSGSTVAFPLTLRIPAWAEETRIMVGGKREQGVKPGTFHMIEREWKDGDEVEVIFPMRLGTTRYYHDSVAIERGPIVFSLKVGEDWKQLKGEAPHADWEVHPTSSWNYGLVIDPKHPEQSLTLEERPVGKIPFSPEGAPLRLKAKGHRIVEWKLVAGSAGPLPKSPVRPSGPEETLTLIPYGSAKLRVTAFPQIEDGGRSNPGKDN